MYLQTNDIYAIHEYVRTCYQEFDQIRVCDFTKDLNPTICFEMFQDTQVPSTIMLLTVSPPSYHSKKRTTVLQISYFSMN